MRLLFVASLGLLIALGSCKDDDPEPMLPERGEINLTTPLSRQKTTYQQFTTNCRPSGFDTDNDTIILEVVLEDGIKYFDEYGTAGSMSSEVRAHRTRMRILPEVGVLRIFDRSDSYLFASLPGDEILLDSTYSEVLWQAEFCEILTVSDSSRFVGSVPGLITNFTLDTVLSLDQKFMTPIPAPAGSEYQYTLYDARHLYLAYDANYDPGAGTMMTGWMRIKSE
jgi:hypothetical protein